MSTSPDQAAADLASFVDASPTPFHACETAAALLDAAGWSRVSETDAFVGGRGYLVRGGSLVAWDTTHASGPATPFRVVAAHTDSPNLRLKPQPDLSRAGWQLVGVEVYGGPLLSTWLDRDLGLSGRLSLRSADGVRTRLVRIDEPLLRVSNLAIHLNRGVNAEGLVLNPQQHLAPHWAIGNTPGDIIGHLAGRLDIDSHDVLAWDLMTHDLTPARRTGGDRATLAAARLDNQTTASAATRALIGAGAPTSPLVQVVVLFDHEEVGSVSERGAGSALLTATLERLVLAAGGGREDLLRALAGTVILSGDAAHATHPNYAEKHEPQHTVAMNGGPVLKINSQLRYATDSVGASHVELAAERAGVPLQRFVTRTDLPCGSTVGPMISASTGATTVDVGTPTLSMHSARELAGVADQAYYVDLLAAFLAP
ncbi:M18 family aminopeptidase [Nakamurella deserti]|uniref:M18 family aminopeptidase n=1 Tax=Nakamurella deserti TaxID=2164074 RepID=UPI000DBE1871|nr:M18 family aminopeptidase [Nakamurella deserti]